MRLVRIGPSAVVLLVPLVLPGLPATAPTRPSRVVSTSSSAKASGAGRPAEHSVDHLSAGTRARASRTRASAERGRAATGSFSTSCQPIVR